jgi:hypothetical protein
VKHFWVTCTECGDAWVAGYIAEHGLLVATDETGEACTDCGGQVEIQDEYDGPNEDDTRDEVRFDF